MVTVDHRQFAVYEVLKLLSGVADGQGEYRPRRKSEREKRMRKTGRPGATQLLGQWN